MTDKKTALFIVNFVAESVNRAEKKSEKIEESKVETPTEVQTTETDKEPQQEEPPAVPPRSDVPDIPTIYTIQPPKNAPLPPTIKATKAPPPPKSVPAKLQKAESSGDFLSELITKGSKALKKVEILPELSHVDNQDDLAGALAKALAARRNFIKDKDDSDDEQTWDD